MSNPILRGFNPDPSIVRVGDDYYIATSTFEWFPGVQIHHSRDLVDWRLIARPLNRPSQLDMPRPCAGGGPWGFSWAGAAAAATRNRTVVLKTWALFFIRRRKRRPS